MSVRWPYVLLVILLILALAYSRQIADALRPLRIGEMWQEFCEEIWRMPSLGRFTLVALVMALLYLTIYFLILRWGRK